MLNLHFSLSLYIYILKYIDHYKSLILYQNNVVFPKYMNNKCNIIFVNHLRFLKKIRFQITITLFIRKDNIVINQQKISSWRNNVLMSSFCEHCLHQQSSDFTSNFVHSAVIKIYFVLEYLYLFIKPESIFNVGRDEN